MWMTLLGHGCSAWGWQGGSGSCNGGGGLSGGSEQEGGRKSDGYNGSGRFVGVLSANYIDSLRVLHRGLLSLPEGEPPSQCAGLAAFCAQIKSFVAQGAPGAVPANGSGGCGRGDGAMVACCASNEGENEPFSSFAQPRPSSKQAT